MECTGKNRIHQYAQKMHMLLSNRGIENLFFVNKYVEQIFELQCLSLVHIGA